MKKVGLIHFIIPFACIFLMITCKQESKTVDINGKRIKSIQSNTILTEDGQQLVLPEDSISKIFYLVRHAEKDTTIKEEPPLNEEGLKRSSKIADIMRGTRVDAIYSTMTLRTMYTVDSLADIKAMSIKPYDNKELKKMLDFVKESQEFNRVFIVGHSNTIPAITNSLAGSSVFNRNFDENEYDNFVVVVVKKSGLSDSYLLKY
jgi:phosphohistidine phosphatase SixA